MVNLTMADISDSAGAHAILDGIHTRWPLIRHAFADGADDRRKLMEKAAFLDFTVEIVRRTDEDFVVLPRRRVVEPTSDGSPATDASCETMTQASTSPRP